MTEKRNMRLECDVGLPASKSESNRALMIAAYGGFAPDFQNLSDSNDTSVIAKALSVCGACHAPQIVDIEDCGTAARFMLSFLASHNGEWLLKGSARMGQRPIAPLVDALQLLGADVQYIEKQDFLPLRIFGKPLTGGKVAIDMSQSSQFASSLLLSAPMWHQGAEIELFGSLSSLPYLDMTIALMRHFGANVQRRGRIVVVEPKPYQYHEFTVSPDWSAASYWFEVAALSEACEIRLRGVKRLSLQGDAIIAEWMKTLGVTCEEIGNDLVLSKMPAENRPHSFDFNSCPDLFPTMVATCAGLQLDACFTGVANLRIKESDRVEAMRMELAKIGAELKYHSENELVLKPSKVLPFFEKSNPLFFESHGDHRVVMALAPLSLRLGALTFDHPEVVRKSYPKFWDDACFLPIIR